MSDAEMIAQHIATRGVTRCPTAYAGSYSTGELSDAERAIHAQRVDSTENPYVIEMKRSVERVMEKRKRIIRNHRRRGGRKKAA